MAMSTETKIEKELGEMLVENNLITGEQLEASLELQVERGGKLSEILIEQGLVTPQGLGAMLSIKLNVPLIDLKRHAVQPDALRLIPEEIARKHTLIPIDVIGDSLLVVMASPEDVRTIEDIKAQAKMKVEVALGIPADIERAIDLNYKSGGAIEKQVDQFVPLVEEAELRPEPAARTPVIQTLDLLIAQAVRNKASDIHIEPQEDRLRVRYRIDGILHDMYSLPMATHAQLVSRVKIMAEMNIAEQRRPQDGQFSIKVGGRDIDIRAATMETQYGERAVLRILDKSLSLLALPELGMLPDVLRKYQQVLKSPFGLILVGGPTGSGKTTTLYASINELDRNENNILTVEDPIEYRFQGINQTQVNPKAGMTFEGGLRSIMRHDPDIILVGEIRDRDTAAAAVQAALTGHLVLSSIHANDAVSVFSRLMNLGVEPYLISTTLIAIVSQRMVRRVCPHCRAAYQPSEDDRAAYREEMQEEPATFYRGAGCNLCFNTGYLGRTGLFELLLLSGEIKKMMLAGNANTEDAKAQALSDGMVTMKHDGMLKVRQGITTVSEVLGSVALH